MSRHEMIASRSGAVTESIEIRVPLNVEKFRRYRDMQAGIAAIGMAMTLGTCSFPALLLYIWVVDPAERDIALGVVGASLSLLLPLFIGSATWPAMQIAKTLTKTLKENLPALVINQEGVWDYSSNYVFGFIPWGEIDTVMVDSRYSRKLNKDFPGIAFVVKNKNVLLRRKPGLLASWMNLEPEITDRRQVFIPQARMDSPIGELVRMANSFRQRQMNEGD